MSAGFFTRHLFLRRIVLSVADLALLALALGLAYFIGFGINPNGYDAGYQLQFLYVVGPLVLFRMALLQALGVYGGFTRYAGVYELTSIVLSCVAGTVMLVLFNVLAEHIHHLGDFPTWPDQGHIRRVPWPVTIIDAMASVALVGGVQMGRRMLSDLRARILPGASRRVLVIGAGDAGEMVARDLLKNQRDRYRPVAFIDPDAALHGRRIHGIPVIGGLDNLQATTQELGIEVVVVALPRPTPFLLRRLVAHCQQARLEFKLVPNVDSVMAGRVQISQMRSVEIEDLLGRPPIVLPSSGEKSYLTGRRVLVTGAGGSIGSELCRQVLAHRPATLALLGRGENSIYEIGQEIETQAREQGAALEIVVGDVRDAGLVEAVCARLRPEIVFHAAAHKHVHFMEAQPAEAIKNNVGGTRVLAEAARRHGALRFILISTDKAVRPKGYMGASKRIAEMVVCALNGARRAKKDAAQEAGEPTRFIAVRFGNVLGSRGSVIPHFRRQIAAGGPVTVTHPDARRYFMTIPEAVSLVIDAGARGEGGEVFLLDMGQPVRISDLARQLITLSGLEPDRDIAIVYTGLRPGEKLLEELLTPEEARADAGHPKIFRSPQAPLVWETLAARIAELEAAAERDDRPAIHDLMHAMIPDFDDERA